MEAGLLRERDGAEETVDIVIRTGGKEELIDRSVCDSPLTELNGPDIVDLDGPKFKYVLSELTTVFKDSIRDAGFDSEAWAVTASAIWSPIARIGSSEVIGFCGIIAT